MENKTATISSEFFPLLTRRDNYTAKANGKFYAYRYFRANYQHEIAEDCVCRCVYCDSHENEMGGREQMQIDHFRPYTRAGFEHLEDAPKNFHHACVRCNSLKSDKWPSTNQDSPHDDIVGFIDPFVDDRRCYFSVEDDGELIPLRPPAEYLIRVLALNRRHLKLLRIRRILQAQLRAYFSKNSEQWEQAARGEGEMTLEEAGQSLLECKRLFSLCSFGGNES
jgi:5-methylcytosine-specific restriction endonuclease McrA